MEVAHPASVLLLLTVLVMPLGCQESAPPAPVPTAQNAVAQPAQTGPAKPSARDHWFAWYLRDGKLGYLHVAGEPSGKLIRWKATSHLVIQRQGQPTEVDLSFVSLETPAGEVRSLGGSAKVGPTPINFEGRVDGDQLELETLAGETPQVRRIAWKPGYRGFFGVEQSLVAQPMQPGENRTVEKIEPIVNQVVSVKLTAKDFETVTLLDGEARLLRIEQTLTFPDGNTLDSVVWTDRHGVTQKLISSEQMTAYRTTKDQALAKGPVGRFDLALDTLVKLNRRLENPYATKQIRYRIRLSEHDPAKVFAAGATQRIEPQEDGSVLLTVRSLRPDTETDDDWPATSKPPTEADTGSNPMVQTDDPKIREIANSVAPDETDRWKLACALEKRVYNLIRRRNFSQAFASAADVARDPQGDCTEHAVLLAALARVRGIPARLAIGLVYINTPDPAFAYHMWNEVYINNRWIPLDGTLGRGGTGAAHLKLTHTSLEDGSAYTAFLPVSKVLGKLQVTIEDVKN